MKNNNIHIIGINGEEEKEQEIEKLYGEIITKKFHHLGEKINKQIQEVQSPKKDKTNEAQT